MPKRRANREGSIYKDGKYWCAAISLKDGSRKKKRSKYQYVVREWLQEQKIALESGYHLNDNNVRFSEFLDYYLDNIAAPTVKPKTLDSYRWLIESHIRPSLGSIPITKIDQRDIQDLMSLKLEEGLSKRSVQHMHAVVRKALNEALMSGLIYRNPALLVSAPRPDKKPFNTLTKEQARLFLESVKDHRWYPIYVLAITTGMRQGEILGLHWESINFENRTLSVQYTLQYSSGHMALSEPKTASSRRTISLSPFALNVLKYLKKDNGPVFTTSTGNFVSARNIIRHFHAALEKAGLPRMRFHDLRHTAATLLLKENVHPKVVQEMLGHSSIMLTLDTYSHILPDIQQEASDKMEKMFG